MKKIICPSCQKPSYTAAIDSNLPCPFCGFFLFGDGGLDRRALKRVLTQNECEIFNGGTRLSAQAVDISKTGVGIKIPCEVSFDRGDSVNIIIQNFEVEGSARVVWIQKSNDDMLKVGLRFT